MPEDLESPSRFTLPNGLRVVLCRRGTAPLAAVCVHYDVGFRSEPEGRSGFAHLFEHLMFQGSENVGRSEHFTIVQGSGGTANGSTRQDYTEYYQIAPASALERLLFLEADRMRTLRLTQNSLDTQLAVVKEEIKLNVHDRPYGGFPWTNLPSVLFRKFCNAHNGYGDFIDLDRATLEECAAFFDGYYTPSNAVLTIAGDIDPARTLEWVTRHFGDIPARPAAAPQDLAEPWPSRPRTGDHIDPRAPLSATAVGYRLPDPVAGRERYLGHIALAALLGGPSGRLRQQALARGVDLTTATAQCGFFGPFDARDPDTFVVTARHPSSRHREVTGAVTAALEDLAGPGPDDAETAAAIGGTVARWHRRHDNLLTFARAVGASALLHDEPSLPMDLPGHLEALGPGAVRDAAGSLAGGAPAALLVHTRDAGGTP
ncbi:pitrilysin family protein [Streptomyces racemochromogenes]|uniref:M16 family metallopeptidase n=1 Tax=Streptomyces racemochromogenes TaxID=67353 RepID=UPI0031E4F7DF